MTNALMAREFHPSRRRLAFNLASGSRPVELLDGGYAGSIACRFRSGKAFRRALRLSLTNRPVPLESRRYAVTDELPPRRLARAYSTAG